MQSVIDNFLIRTREVEKYYKVLEVLDDERISIIKHYSSRRRKISLDSDALKIMKSTCFLLLYNLVESTVRESFTTLYEQINKEESTLEYYNEYFRKLWLHQHFKTIDPISSNQNTYRTVASTIVEKILNSETFEMKSDHLPISGNLDAKKIKELFKKHKIKLQIHHKALGGGELQTVKDKRNGLAHGNISFSECGQEYTVKDLINIKKKTVSYLKSSLTNIKRYSEKRGYVA